MRKVYWVMISVALVALMYYVFIKPYEFEVRFKAKTLPGDLIGTLRIWNRSLDSAQIVKVDSFKSLRQNLFLGNRSYVYNWNFTSMDDSVTKVNVRISEPNRSILNKILVPFTKPVIEEDANTMVSQFYDVLKIHLDITKVKVVGEVELDSMFCVCKSLNTGQSEKANGMMKEYSLLTSFITNFKLESDGPPSVRILKWSHSLGLLEYDFCFPIREVDSLPGVQGISYRKFENQKVLKAEYRGNYITSDRAWYTLIQYANENGYKTTGLPIEYFYDNPNLGINEVNWKADVYLPISN